jgi:hypothetical protein
MRDLGKLLLVRSMTRRGRGTLPAALVIEAIETLRPRPQKPQRRSILRWFRWLPLLHRSGRAGAVSMSHRDGSGRSYSSGVADE